MPVTDRDGVTLEYGSRGEGPVVVVVPDACVGPWMYAWVVAELAGVVRVVTVAPRGCAGSDPAPNGGGGAGYAVGEQTEDLEAVLEALAVQRVHLVGCGFGGQVCLRYAFDHGRARSLTLLGTERSPTVDAETRATLCDSDPLTSLTPYLGTVLDRLPTDQLRDWRARDDPPPPVRGHQLDAATGFEPPPLHEITVPTRCLVGERDAVWSVAGATTVAEALPHGTVDTVLDAPHLLPVGAPALVADEVVAQVEATTDEDR